MSWFKRFTRREFLTIAGSATALGVSILILRPQTASASVMPPGALAPIALFNAACSRCGKCVSACPHQAIRQNDQGLPYIDGIGGWCDFCMDCAEACPTGALQLVDPKTAVIGIAEVNRDRCIPWIRSGCRLCYEKCNDIRQAIQLDTKQRPSVDANRCNGCAACVFVCPQPGIEGGNKNLGKAVSVRVI